MGRRSIKDGDESLAACLLHAVLAVDVCRADRPGAGNSMYDLRLTYPDGRQAAAEVVSTRDDVAMKVEGRAFRLGYVTDHRLTRSWLVTVTDEADVRKVRRKIPSLLLELESHGLERLPQYYVGDFHMRARALGVRSCSARGLIAGRNPGFRLHPLAKGAFQGDGDRIVRELNDFLPAVPSKAAKLLASGLSERHLVVVATEHRFDLLTTLRSGQIPASPPTLPRGVDWLWLVSPYGPPPVASIHWDGRRWELISLDESALEYELFDC